MPPYVTVRIKQALRGTREAAMDWYFQKKVMMDLILQIIIALNQLNVLLSFLCLLRAQISRKVTHDIYKGTMIDKRKCL